MASETVDPIDWSHVPPSWAVPPERLVHSINRCSSATAEIRTCNVATFSMRGNHLAYAATQGIKLSSIVLSNGGLGIKSKSKKCLHEGVIVPTALYGADAWGMRSDERRKVNVLEMKCLRSLVGVSRLHKVKNEGVRRRAGIIIIIIIIIILLKQDYKVQLANNKIQMAWLTYWLVFG